MPTASRLGWMNAWEADLTPSAAAKRSAARVEGRVTSTRYYGREATARIPQPAPEAETTKALPQLKVVTRHKPRWGAITLALVAVGLLLGACIVAPMLIHSAATGLEAEVGKIESQEKELAAATSALSAQISALSSPDRVAGQAARLGLGPAQSVHYLESDAHAAATEGDTTVAGR